MGQYDSQSKTLRGGCHRLSKIEYHFVGGLSLHLKLRLAIWDTFGIFGSNLDTRDLKTYPRTYSGHFWNISLFGDSRAIWVLFRKWVVSENQFSRWRSDRYPLISLVLGGEVLRLNHSPICFPIQNSKGVLHAVESWLPLFRWFKFTKPPYSIACGKLRLAIWDTSLWTFWLKFGHKGPWDIS